MTQLILHLIGDYITQSDWMATRKTSSTVAATAHATVYALPFLLIGNREAVFLIWATHLLIDRFRLARYLVWAKNIIIHPAFILGVDNDAEEAELKRLAWKNCKATGYPSDSPLWLTVWLMIIADNTLHLAINAASLHFLGGVS